MVAKKALGFTGGSFVLALATVAALEQPSQAIIDESTAGVWAVVGDQRVPVEVGSVVTTGSLVDDKCQFVQGFGLEVVVPEGATPLEVEWVLQDGCQIVVNRIGPFVEVPNTVYLNNPDIRIPRLGGVH